MATGSMMQLDRRWLFLVLAIVCIGAYMAKDLTVPILVKKEVRNLYQFIDSLPPGEIVFVSISYDPNAQAELHPMAFAVIEHCFRKNLRVIFPALSQNGSGMADQAIRAIADSMKVPRTYNGVEYPAREIKSGEDYVFLGYKPYFAIVILSMGQDFRQPFPKDYYGVPLDSLPMMQGVRNYRDIACVLDLSGGNITDAWISYGQARFNFPLFLGVTGVQAAQYYPYLNSGQIQGLMAGMLGAAQYEQLADNPGLAKDGMRVQLFGHFVIILFILVGNIGYFMARRKQ